ncbi:hypothetical protein LPJ61_003828 [Coemansia biformis]|uniref:Uncharacterized protein n=1 Tax=Coemansia biformis TaxID=1286918 RepID=A0A9W7YD42_9FUNG|nr:hypothetical protein LPJ61_003828 [Coemansia biformis]
MLWQRPLIALPRRAGAGRRGLACLSVYVNYGTHETTVSDLRALFEQVGSVWDVTPAESGASGRQQTRALVRFYAGEHQPGDSPGAPPQLPPPSDAEIAAVTKAADDAVGRFDRSMLNGAQIFVRKASSSPWQLHVWYENRQAAEETARHRPRPEIFPVNPFHEHARQEDDYQKGFMAGFRLGLKDGSQGPNKD